MIGKPVRPTLHPETLEQASAWFVDFSEGGVGPEGRQDFVRWLRASPEHVRGYLEIAALWEHASLIDRKREATPDVLVARALASGTVVPLELPDRPAGRADSKAGAAARAVSMKPRRRFAIVSAAAAMALAAVLVWHGATRAPVFETAIGEQRFVPLADGSTVSLNSRSRIRVHFGEAERHVELLEGQALFQVAKDPQRPFKVQSGQVSVQAIGTQFDVHRRKAGTTVTVLEGQVSVARRAAATPAGAAGGVVLVAAGEQVTVTPLGRARPQAADIAAATAWTRHEIVFAGTALADVVEEFNRYNAVRLVIDDPGIAGIRISGVFSSTDPSALLLFLGSLPEFSIVEEGDTIRITGP